MARNFGGAGVMYVNTIPSALDNVNTMTWTMWVRRNSTFFGWYAAKRDTTGVFGKNMTEAGASGDAIKFEVVRATTNAVAQTADGAIPTNTWKFVAVTWDGAAAPKIYMADSGGSVSDVTGPGANAGSGTIQSEATGNFCIGARNSGTSGAIDARFADFRVYGTNLGLTDIQNIMRGARVRPDQLLAWWPLFGSSSPEIDWGGRNLQGTLAGSSSQVDHPPAYSLLWAQRPSRTRKPGTTQVRTIDSRANLLSTTTKTINSIGNIVPRSTVTTKLYITNSPPEFPYTVEHGVWDRRLDDTMPRKALKTYTDGPNTSFALTSTALADYDVLLGRWVSPPIQAYTFTAEDTVRWVFGVNGPTNLHGKYHLYVSILQGNTETERGTVLPDAIGATEWSSIGTGRGEGIVNLAPVVAQNGDRILIEVGFRSNASVSNLVGRLYYGGEAATGSTDFFLSGAGMPIPVEEGIGSDITQGSTNVTTEQGWLEFETGSDLFTFVDHTIDSRATIVGKPNWTLQSTGAIRVTDTRTIDSTGNVRNTTLQTISSRASLLITTPHTIGSTGFIASETSAYSIGSTGNIASLTGKFIGSTGCIQRVVSASIGSTGTIQFGGVEQSIGSTARIVQPQVKRRYKVRI